MLLTDTDLWGLIPRKGVCSNEWFKAHTNNTLTYLNSIVKYAKPLQPQLPVLVYPIQVVI